MGCVSSKDARFAAKLGPADEGSSFLSSKRHRRKSTADPLSRKSSTATTATDNSVISSASPRKIENFGKADQVPPPPRFSFKTKVNQVDGTNEGKVGRNEPHEVVPVESLIIDTEVMKQAGMFEAMDAKAREPKSPLKVNVEHGKRSSMILESFEEKERLAHTLPEKVEVEKKVGGEVGAKLQGFESAEAKVRAEPKLEKCFSQRLSERGEGISHLQLAKAVS